MCLSLTVILTSQQDIGKSFGHQTRGDYLFGNFWSDSKTLENNLKVCVCGCVCALPVFITPGHLLKTWFQGEFTEFLKAGAMCSQVPGSKRKRSNPNYLPFLAFL